MLRRVAPFSPSALADASPPQIQSDDHFNNTVDVQYRREVPFHYSQYVHRTGLAFVQCLPDGRGFLWLDNRLYTEKKESKNVSDFKPIKERMERLRSEFRAFCASKEELAAVWEEAKREREREWAEQVSFERGCSICEEKRGLTLF